MMADDLIFYHTTMTAYYHVIYIRGVYLIDSGILFAIFHWLSIWSVSFFLRKPSGPGVFRISESLVISVAGTVGCFSRQCQAHAESSKSMSGRPNGVPGVENPNVICHRKIATYDPFCHHVSPVFTGVN